MKEKLARFFFVLLGICLVGVVVGQSYVETEFNVNGCTFIFEGEEYGVSAGKCSSGDIAGYFFCESGFPTIPWDTREEGRGCSMGSDTYEVGDDFCCPAGMFCNETENGLFKCERRVENCFKETDRSSCEEKRCIWMDLTSECVDDLRSYDCSYYTDNTTCSEDKWGLGRIGIGTDVCGSTIECGGDIFTISSEGCGCKWYSEAPFEKNCQLNIVVTQTFYSETPDKFECSNVYDAGPCVDGVMNVTWSSHNNVISGFDDTNGEIPIECLEEVGCNGGEASRFCGEELIKLPGFSFFGFFFSLGIIGVYFLITRREEILR